MRDISVERTCSAGGLATGGLDLDYIDSQIGQYPAAEETFLISKVQGSVTAKKRFFHLVGWTGRSLETLQREYYIPRLVCIATCLLFGRQRWFCDDPTARGSSAAVCRYCYVFDTARMVVI